MNTFTREWQNFFCGVALHLTRPRLPWVQSRRQTVLEAGDRRFGAVFELVDGGARGALAFRVEVEVQVGLSLYADATPHGDAVGRWALGVGLGWNRPLRERIISGCHDGTL